MPVMAPDSSGKAEIQTIFQMDKHSWVHTFSNGAKGVHRFLNLWFNDKLTNDAWYNYHDVSVKLIKDHGIITATKVLKDINNRAKQIALQDSSGDTNKSAVVSLGGIWFKVDKQGFPKCLKTLKKLLLINPKPALIITNIVYGVTHKPVLDISTVTDPFKGDKASLEVFIKDFEKFLNATYPRWLEVSIPKVPHFSLKYGPNEMLSLTSVAWDAICLHANSCFVEFAYHCKIVGMGDWVERLKSMVYFYDHDVLPSNLSKKPQVLKLAKLSFLGTASGKTRVIFILSYWIQELVRPLHRAMFDWLKDQPQDATFDQRKAVEDIRLLTLQKVNDLYSFDLTAATDRWPKIHQKVVVKHLYGDSWADVWDWVMSITPWVKGKGYVSYSVGQPMGAYSSWAALAVTHHALIRYCAWKLSIKDPVYFVLGDDVLIKGHSLAQEYHECLNTLGVDISIGKSITPKGNTPAAEFAKNLLRGGMNLTALSPNEINEIMNNHFWWKFVDFTNLIQGWDGKPHVYIDQQTNVIAISKALESVISNCGFTHNQINNIMILLGYHQDQFNKQLIGYHSIRDNPWKGVTSLEMKMKFLEIILEEIGRSSSQISNLITKMEEGLNPGNTPDKVLPDLLNYPQHPVRVLLADIRDQLKACYSAIANGDYPDGVDDMLVDVNTLTLWFEGKDSSFIGKSLRDIRKKRLNLRIIEVHNSLLDTNISSQDHFEGYE